MAEFAKCATLKTLVKRDSQHLCSDALLTDSLKQEVVDKCSSYKEAERFSTQKRLIYKEENNVFFDSTKAIWRVHAATKLHKASC